MVIPDKTSLDQAIATVRKAYKDDYAKKKDSQKRALGRKLGLEAEKSKDDASLYYAMLDESARLAGDTEDYDQLLTSIEHLGQAFKGFDQAGRKRTELAKLKGKPTAVAILKLMDDPEDKAANGVVGRFFCFNLGSWELGLPLLSLGTDPDLHKAAEMELAVPKDAGERKATGDAWYEFGRKSATDKISAWTRAQWWYGQAQPNLAGVNKEMIQLRLDEIEKVLPQVVTDYLNISPKQWDRLKGVTVTVEARKGRSETNLSLQPGQRLRIVPQPTDTWQISYTTDVYGCTAKGVDPNGDAVIWRGMRTGKYRYGALVCQVGSGSVVLPGIVDGNGPLWLMPFTNGKDASLSSGTIRVKILKVSDDE